MTEAQKLKQAIIIYREANGDILAVNTFVALYNMLGSTELHDGIKSAMEDEDMGEAYEDIMYHFEGDER